MVKATANDCENAPSKSHAIKVLKLVIKTKIVNLKPWRSLTP